MNKTCFLFGHADCPDSIMPKLEQALEACCSNYGITDFYVGNRGAFDRMAAAAVMRMKKSKDIKLYLLLAYHPGERPIDLWGGFDGTYYPPLENTPRKYAIVKANQYMLRFSDRIVCYVWHQGNTWKLLEVANRRNIPAVNLAEER